MVPVSRLAVLGVAIALALAGCASVPAPDSRQPTSPTADASTPAPTPTSPPALEIDIETGAPPAGTDAAIAWEALMSPEGEYAAAASYQAVLDAFGTVEPYASILSAELRHIDALVRQLEKAGFAAPDNPYLGLIAAPASLAEAAQAWATGEIDNVAMYDSLIAQASDAALVRVLDNLRSASLNSHLPLFEAAAANGGTLTAEQMSSVGS